MSTPPLITLRGDTAEPGDESYSILAYDYQAGMEPGGAVPDGPEQQPKGMTEEELLAIVRAEMTEAVGFIETTPEQRRARLLRRYLGEKYGNEQEGYSAVVSRDVFEVVEWALPQLVETFLAGDMVARFDPVGPEDEEEAKQQTDLANHVFLKENNGFLLLSTAFKDALIQEIGIVHWYWEQPQRADYEFYEGVTEEQVTVFLANDPDLQISAAMPSAYGVGLWDVEVRRTYGDGKLCIEAIPPEEFFYSPDARNLEDARCVGRHRKVTASEMIDYGYDPEVVRSLTSDYGGAQTSGELARISRDDQGTGSDARNGRRDSEREIDLAELWVRVDFDGDGISELRKVAVASNAANVSRLLHHEPATRKPFAVASPILMPHRFAGISLAETVEDIAEIRTAVMRAYLNGLYLVQRPRTIVLGDPENGPMADTDELMSVVPGGFVTEYAPQAIREFPTQDVTTQSLTGLEMLKGMREERTGITRTWQGTEAPNNLNDTAHGMQMLTNAAGKRLAYIARIFAETLVKDLFTGIAATLKEHQRIAKVVRLRGAWTSVDPTNWRHEYDATVEVGLGYGDKEAALFNANQMLALQEKVAMYPKTAGMVTADKVFEALSEVAKHMGFKNAERFFNNPATTPAPDAGPDLEEKKLQQEAWLKVKELEVRELEIRLTHEREMAKLGVEVNAPQPDPVPAPPAIEMDLGAMTDAMMQVKEAAAQMNGNLATEMAALRETMAKPRKVQRDETGRIVGTSPEA